MKRITIVIAIILIGGVSPAFAWNDHGHMTVAAIAWTKLTPVARDKVASLLKLNPSYASWTQKVPEQDRAETAFILAATWPDAIKRDNSYQNDGANNGDVAPTSGAAAKAAAQNIGYKDHLRHKYWHFIDEPFSPDGTGLVQPVPPNAATQIATFRAALSSNASDDVKSYDLAWLEHIVGDVHQPLHATSRFTRDLPNGDAGGNRVSLCAAPAPPKCRDELHGFWDDVLGTSESVSAAQHSAASIAAGRSTPPAERDETVWINESFDLAKSAAYGAPIGAGKGPFALDAAYKAKALKTANDRVWLAGNRLADLIAAALQ